MAEEINKTYTSNSLYNDSTGVIAFAEQLKQELINWANYQHVTEELGQNRPDLQSELNNLFLSVYERFLTFLNDADASEEAINTWKEIENFLADYADDKTLASIVAELNNKIESRLTVPLESTTGSSTTSTMTQKAITETIDASKTFTTGEKVDNVGIDSEPTIDSENLIKSGGVADIRNFLIVQWNTDVSTTRLQVPLSKRKYGLTIVYYNPLINSFVTECYNTSTFSDGIWMEDRYWSKLNYNLGDTTDENITVPNSGYVYHTPTSSPTNTSILVHPDYVYSNPVQVKKGDLVIAVSKNLLTNLAVICECDSEGNNRKVVNQAIDGSIDIEYRYIAPQDGYVIVCVRNAYTNTRVTRKGGNPITRVLEKYQKWINDNNDNVAFIPTLQSSLGFTPAYLESLKVADANELYLNPNYEMTFASNDIVLTNPIWLHIGDTITVHTPAMGASNTVVGRATTDSISTSSFNSLIVGNNQSGYQDYTYVVDLDGYYVVSWDKRHSSCYARINHLEYSNFIGLNNDIELINSNLNKLNTEIGAAINVFGDILPKSFKSKYFNGLEDTEVVCVGDSLTGLIQYCGATDNPSHLPPGMTYKHWTYLLWDRLCLNKPICDRLDSQRDNIDVFTKVGTFESYDGNSGTAVNGTWGEHSVSANTYRSNNLDAEVSFVFDADSYEKCNIVFSMNTSGCQSEVVIVEGNGKMLASLDKTTWIEANGFTVTQTTSNMQERHRRIWMKKASDSITGDINISYKRSASDTNTSHYLYFWGTEKWGGASLFLTNLGRGGRNIDLLNTNRSDIFDRKPDLCILELPLANETLRSIYPLNTLKTNYSTYLTNFASATNNYSDTELLIILPHGRAVYYNGNDAIKISNTSEAVDMINHFKCKNILNYVASLLSSYPEHTGTIDLMEQLINEGFNKNYTIQEWLSASTLSKSTMTADGIHLNYLGSRYWNKYLSPIFQ